MSIIYNIHLQLGSTSRNSLRIFHSPTDKGEVNVPGGQAVSNMQYMFMYTVTLEMNESKSLKISLTLFQVGHLPSTSRPTYLENPNLSK